MKAKIFITTCLLFFGAMALQAQDKPIIPDAAKLGTAPQIESQKSDNRTSRFITYGQTRLQYYIGNCENTYGGDGDCRSSVNTPKLGKGIKREDHKFITKSYSSQQPYSIAADGIVFIPGVGVAGYKLKMPRNRKIMPELARNHHDINHQYEHSGEIIWIIGYDGSMIIPSHNEYVHAHGLKDGIIADRVFYCYGNRKKYQEKIKNANKGQYSRKLIIHNDKPLPKDNGAFLFSGNTIEKEWKNLAELNDNRFFAKYIRYNYEGYLQLGELDDDALFITTLSPELTIKNKYGPALSILKESLFETGKFNRGYAFPSADSWKKQSVACKDLKKENRTLRYTGEDEVFLLENHDAPGLFLILTSRGEVFAPENSLGVIPFLSTYRFDNAEYVSKRIYKDTLHFASGLITVYSQNNKMLYNYISLKDFTTWKSITDDESLHQPKYSDYEAVNLSVKGVIMQKDVFTNTHTLMALGIEDKLWYAVSNISDQYSEKVWAADTSLAKSAVLTEEKFDRINRYVSRQEYEKYLAQEKAREELRRSVESSPEYQKRREDYEKMVANMQYNSREARANRRRQWEVQNLKKWDGFSYTRETSERYRQSVERAVQSSPIPTKTTLEYKNGVIVRTY